MLNSRDESLAEAGWKWRVRMTYKEDHFRGKGKQRQVFVRAGDLAIETVHKDDHTKDMEIAAATGRGDVDIEIVQLKEEL